MISSVLATFLLFATVASQVPITSLECQFTSNLCGWTSCTSLYGQCWTLLAGRTSSYNTGPSNDHTSGNSNGKYVYFETSSPSYPYKTATMNSSQAVSVVSNPGEQCLFYFWYHAYGSAVNELSVQTYVPGDPGGYRNQWQLTNHPPRSLNAWRQDYVDLGAHAGGTPFYMSIVGISGHSYTSDVAIDDTWFSLGCSPLGITGFSPIAAPVGDGVVLTFTGPMASAGLSVGFHPPSAATAPLLDTDCASSTVIWFGSLHSATLNMTGLNTLGDWTLCLHNPSGLAPPQVMTSLVFSALSLSSSPTLEVDSTTTTNVQIQGADSSRALNTGLVAGTWSFARLKTPLQPSFTQMFSFYIEENTHCSSSLEIMVGLTDSSLQPTSTSSPQNYIKFGWATGSSTVGYAPSLAAFPYGSYFNTGDTVSVNVTLSPSGSQMILYKNGVSQGQLSAALTYYFHYYPAIAMACPNNAVSFVPNPQFSNVFTAISMSAAGAAPTQDCAVVDCVLAFTAPLDGTLPAVTVTMLNSFGSPAPYSVVLQLFSGPFTPAAQRGAPLAETSYAPLFASGSSQALVMSFSAPPLLDGGDQYYLRVFGCSTCGGGLYWKDVSASLGNVTAYADAVVTSGRMFLAQIRMKAVMLELTSNSSLSALVGQQVLLTITSPHTGAGDQVKWVASSCSDVAGGGVGTITLGDPAVGTPVTFTQPGRFKLCYRYSVTPSFFYYQQSTVVVRQLSSLSSSVVLLNQTLSVVLNGVRFTSYDALKWVPASATHCAEGGSDAQGGMGVVSVSRLSTVRALATLVPLSSGSGFQLCYRFGSMDFELYPQFTLDVYNVLAIDGSTATVGFVVQQAKTITLSGVGLAAGDSVKFVDVLTATSSDCQQSPRGGIAEQTVTSSLQVTLDFQLGGVSWGLCYRFASFGSYQLYPALRVDAKRISGVNVTDAVVGIPTLITGSGTGVTFQDDAKWVLNTVITDAQCAGATAYGTGVFTMNPQTGSSELVATFTQSSLTLVLCWRFHGLGYKLYHGFAMTASDVLAVDASQSVVGAVKTITISGDGVATKSDLVKWVPASATACGATPADAQGGVGEVAVQCGGAVPVLFTTAGDGQSWQMCYKFGPLPWKLYPQFTMQLSQLTSVDTTSVVLGQSRTITFTGTNLPPAATAVKWVDNSFSTDADCGVGATNALSVGEVALSSVTATTFTATLTFTAPALNMKLCYRAGSGNSYTILNQQLLTVHEVTGLASNNAPLTFAVVGNSVAAAVTGTGIAANDTLRFVANGTVSDARCTSAPTVGGVGSLSVQPPSPGSSAFTVQLAMTQPALAMVLCYKFGQLPFKMYPAITLDALQVTALTATVGAAATFQVQQPKAIGVLGTGVAAGDQLKFISSTATACGTGSSNAEAEFTTAGSPPTATVTLFQVGAGLRLCYKFGSHPYVMMPQFTANAVLFSGVSPSTLVADIPTNVTLSGAGLSTGDQVRVLPPNSAICTTTSGSTDYAVTNVAATGNSAQVLLTLPSVPGLASVSRALCYRFAGEPWGTAAMFPLTAADIVGVSHPSAVVNVSKVLTFTPSTTSGVAKWIPIAVPTLYATDPCSMPPTPAYATTSTYGVAQATVDLAVPGSFTFLKAGAFQLCFKFSLSPSWKLYPGLNLTVYELSALSPQATVLGTNTSMTFTGFAVGAGDTARFMLGVDPIIGNVDCTIGPWITAETVLSATASPAGTAPSLSSTTGWVLFSQARSGMGVVLCYRFALETYATAYYTMPVQVGEVRAASVTTLVAGVPASVTLSGFAVGAGDKAKWVPLGSPCGAGDASPSFSAVSAPSLPAYGTVFGNGAAATTNGTVNVTLTSPTTHVLCYAFAHAGGSYTQFPQVNVTALDITALAPTSAVRYQFTTLTLTGSRLGDTFWFVSPSATTDAECNTLPHLGGQQFYSADPNGVFLHPSAASSLQLCYHFTGHSVKLYPALSLQIKDLVALSPALVVKDVPTALNITGSGRGASDTMTFELSTLQQCSGVNSAQVGNIPVGAGTIDVTFPVAATFSLCYNFAGFSQQFYPALSVTVRGISSVTPSVAYINVDRRLTFVGASTDGTQAVADTAMWMPSTATGCSGTPAVAPVTVTRGFAVFTFALEQTFKLCYKFGSNPYVFYPAITVAVLPTPVRLSVSLVVTNKPTIITFTGTTPVVANDEVDWLNPGATSGCGTNPLGLRAALTLQAGGAYGASFIFTTPNAGWVMCYKPVGGNWGIAPGITIDSVNIGGMSNPGNPGVPVAVVGAQQTMVFSGSGIQFGDQAKFVLQSGVRRLATTSTPSRSLATVASCTLSGNEALGSNTATVAADGTAVFTFTQSPVGTSPLLQLCYNFRGKTWQLYSLPLNVVTVASISPSVVPAQLSFTLSVSAIGSTTSDSVRLVLANSTTDAHCASQPVATALAGTAMTIPTASLGLKLCYSFSSQPYRLYPNATVNAVLVTSTSSSRAVVSASQVIVVNSTGGAAGDQMKWVDAASPVACAASTPQGGAGTLSVSSGGRVATSFTTSTPGAPWQLCYQFSGASYRKFPSVTMTVAALDVSASSLSVAVVARSTTISLTGTGFTTGDKVKWVDASQLLSQQCGSGAANAQGGVGEVSMTAAAGGTSSSASFYFTSGLAGNSSWALCFQFSGEQYYLFPAITLRVKEVASLAPSTAFVGLPLQFSLTGSGLAAGDQLKFVQSTVTADAQCAAAAAQGGLGTITLSAGAAMPPTTFTGQGGVLLRLCYLFSGQSSWTLYPSVNVNATARALSMSSTAGPSAGGRAVTITGTGFRTAVNYTCSFRFGPQVVTAPPVLPTSATSLTCVTPQWAFVAATTTVSISAADESVSSTLTYSYLAVLTSASSSSGSAAGGAAITITGAGFNQAASDYTCMFFDSQGHNVSSLPLAPSSSTSLTCTTPGWPFPETRTTLTVISGASGLAVVGTANYTYAASFSSSNIISASAVGGAVLSLSGLGFDPAVPADYRCAFRSVGGVTQYSSAVTAISGTLLRCTVPAWANAAGAVTLNVDRLSTAVTIAGSVLFTFQRHILAVSSSSGTAAGGQQLVVTGAGFDVLSTAFVCIFTRHQPSPAAPQQVPSAATRPSSSSSLTCTVPHWTFGEATVNVTVQRGTETSLGALPYAFFAVVSASSANEAPASGGAALTITGAGFDVASALYRCRFSTGGGVTELSSPVQPQTSTSLQCVVPAWLHQSAATVLEVTTPTHTLRGNLTFTLYSQVTTMVPRVGPTSGGTTITLTGSGFGNTTGLLCIFHLLADGLPFGNVTARWLSSTAIQCVSPSTTNTWYPRVSSDGGLTSSRLVNNIAGPTFGVYPQPNVIGLNPAFGRTNRSEAQLDISTCSAVQQNVDGVKVNIIARIGTVKLPTPCVFLKILVNGINTEAVRCTVPPLPLVGDKAVEISLNNGHDFTTDNVLFRFIGAATTLREQLQTNEQHASAAAVALGPYRVVVTDSQASIVQGGVGSAEPVTVDCTDPTGGVCSGFSGNRTASLAAGVVAFADLTLASPTKGTYTLQFSSPTMTQWTYALVYVKIVTGAPTTISFSPAGASMPPQAGMVSSPLVSTAAYSVPVGPLGLALFDAGGNSVANDPAGTRALSVRIVGPVPTLSDGTPTATTAAQLLSLPATTSPTVTMAAAAATTTVSLSTPLVGLYVVEARDSADPALQHAMFWVRIAVGTPVALRVLCYFGGVPSVCPSFTPTPSSTFAAQQLLPMPWMVVRALDGGGNIVTSLPASASLGSNFTVRARWIDAAGVDQSSKLVAGPVTPGVSSLVTGDTSVLRHTRRKVDSSGAAVFEQLRLTQPTIGVINITFSMEAALVLSTAGTVFNPLPSFQPTQLTAQIESGNISQLVASFVTSPSNTAPPCNSANGRVFEGSSCSFAATQYDSVSGTTTSDVVLEPLQVSLADGGQNKPTTSGPQFAGRVVSVTLIPAPGYVYQAIPNSVLSQYYADLTAFPSSTAPTPAFPTLLGSHTAVTDNTGAAYFTGLSVAAPTRGVYVLRFTSPGLAAVEQRVNIVAGAVAEVRLLRRGSTTVGGVDQVTKLAPQLPVGPVVGLVDSIGNLVDAAGVTLTASVDNQVGAGKITFGGPSVWGDVELTAQGQAGFANYTFVGLWASTYTTTISYTSGLPATNGPVRPVTLTHTVQSCPATQQTSPAVVCECSPGYYEPVPGVTPLVCDPCLKGTYRPDTALPVCTACPTSMSTFVPAATSKEQCECTEGTYLDRQPGEQLSGTSCKACPNSPSTGGTWCPARSVGLNSVILRRGYWRARPDSANIYRCQVQGDNAYAECLGTNESVCAPVLDPAARPMTLLQMEPSSATTTKLTNGGDLYTYSHGLQALPTTLTPAAGVVAAGTLVRVPLHYPAASHPKASGAPVWTTVDSTNGTRLYVIPNVEDPTQNLVGTRVVGYYGGVKCSICSPGTGRNREVCEECPAESTNTLLLTAYVIVGLVVVAGMVGSTLLAGKAKVEHEAQLRKKTVRQSMVTFQLQQQLTGTTTGEVANPKLLITATAKIGINYLQLTSLAKQINMEWPPLIATLFSMQERFSSPSLQVSSVDCALKRSGGGSTFFRKFQMMMGAPLLGLAAAACFWFLVFGFQMTPCYNSLASWFDGRIKKWKRSDKKLRKMTAEERRKRQKRYGEAYEPTPTDEKRAAAMAKFAITMMVILFLIHSTLTKQIFSVFACTKIDTKFYLKKELSVECNVGEHLTYTFAAWIFLFVYSLGIPLAGYMLLRSNIRNITYRVQEECPEHHVRPALIMQMLKEDKNSDLDFQDRSFQSIVWGMPATPCTCADARREKKRDQLIERYGFLFNGYKRTTMCPYWEVLPVTLRKVFLLVIVVRFDELAVVIQIMLALILVFCALVLHVEYSPYEVFSLNNLEFMSLLTSFCTLLTGVFFSLNETPTSWRVPLTWFVIVLNAFTTLRILMAFMTAGYMFLPSKLRRKIRHKCCCCFRRKVQQRMRSNLNLLANSTRSRMGSGEQKSSGNVGAPMGPTAEEADQADEMAALQLAQELHGEIMHFKILLLGTSSPFRENEGVKGEVNRLMAASSTLTAAMVDAEDSMPTLDGMKAVDGCLRQLERRFRCEQAPTTPASTASGASGEYFDDSSSSDSELEAAGLMRPKKMPLTSLQRLQLLVQRASEVHNASYNAVHGLGVFADEEEGEPALENPPPASAFPAAGRLSAGSMDGIELASIGLADASPTNSAPLPVESEVATTESKVAAAESKVAAAESKAAAAESKAAAAESQDATAVAAAESKGAAAESEVAAAERSEVAADAAAEAKEEAAASTPRAESSDDNGDGDGDEEDDGQDGESSSSTDSESSSSDDDEDEDGTKE